MTDEVALRPASEDDLPMLVELTQDPGKASEFQWFGWSDPRHWHRGWDETGLMGPEGGTLIVTCGHQRLGFVDWRRHLLTVPSLIPLRTASGRGPRWTTSRSKEPWRKQGLSARGSPAQPGGAMAPGGRGDLQPATHGSCYVTGEPGSGPRSVAR